MLPARRRWRPPQTGSSTANPSCRALYGASAAFGTAPGGWRRQRGPFPHLQVRCASSQAPAPATRRCLRDETVAIAHRRGYLERAGPQGRATAGMDNPSAHATVEGRATLDGRPDKEPQRSPKRGAHDRSAQETKRPKTRRWTIADCGPLDRFRPAAIVTRLPPNRRHRGFGGPRFGLPAHLLENPP